MAATPSVPAGDRAPGALSLDEVRARLCAANLMRTFRRPGGGDAVGYASDTVTVGIAKRAADRTPIAFVLYPRDGARCVVDGRCAELSTLFADAPNITIGPPMGQARAGSDTL